MSKILSFLVTPIIWITALLLIAAFTKNSIRRKRFLIASIVLLMFYGEQFMVSYIPLLILIGGQLIYALAGLTGPLLTMTGHQNIFIIIYFLAFVLDLILNMLFIPLWGAVGAALATACSGIVLCVTMYIIVKKKLSIRASII